MIDRPAPNPLTTRDEAAERLHFCLLGPVEARRGDVTIDLGGPLQRALLACLLLRVGEVVSRERLIDDLWDVEPPPGAGRALETKVSRLRAALGADAPIQARSGGYVIEVAREEIDAERFAQAVADAERLRAEDPAAARAALGETLALWTGEALGGVPAQLLGPERGRLEERRLEAIETRIDLDLELGDGRAVVAELEALHAAHPLRERFTEQLMLAQYRAGRQAEALQTYRDARGHLVYELALEPGPRLRGLEQAILRHDESLGPPPLAHRLARGTRSPRVIAGGLAVTVALVAGIVLLVGGGEAKHDPPEPGVLLVDAATGKLRASIPVGDNQGSTRIGFGDAWSIGENGVVSQVELRRARLVRSIPVGVQGSLAVGAGGVWVTDIYSQRLTRIDPLTGQVNLRRFLPTSGLHDPEGNGGIAVYRGSLWIARGAEAVDRLDPQTLRLERRIRVRQSSCGIPQCALSAGEGRVWVVGGDNGSATGIDAATNRVVAHTKLEAYTCCVAIGGGSVWAAEQKAVVQLSFGGRVLRRIKVRSDAIGNVSFAKPYVWATADSTGELLRIDTTNGAVRTFHFGNGLVGVAASDGVVAVNASAPQGDVTAGLGPKALRIGLTQDWLNSTDPALTRPPRGNSRWQWHLHDATCAQLYRTAPGSAAPVPELAAGAKQSADRLTWTIPLRREFRFSPPVSRLVTPEDVRSTLVRALSPRLSRHPPAVSVLADVAGVNAFRRSIATDVSGIRVRDGALVVRTVRPVPDLPTRLALPYFCVLPAGIPAPPGGFSDRLPTAGPYYVSARGGTTVLRPNPGYRGPRPRHLDGIVFNLNVDDDLGVREVREGRLDLFAGSASTIAPRVGCRTHRPGVPGLDIGALCLRPG